MIFKRKKLDRNYLLKNCTTEQIKKYLRKAIDKESKRFFIRMDTDFIDDCVNWLLELDDIVIDENELKKQKEEIYQRIKLKFGKNEV